MHLPPYGFLSDMYTRLIEEYPLPMDWDAGENSGPLPRLESWEEWKKGVCSGIGRVLWPEYCQNSWQGNAFAFAVELTVEEIEVLDQEFLCSDFSRLHAVPTPPNAASGIGTHEKWYKNEDGELPLGSGYSTYDKHMPGWLSDAVPALIKQGLSNKVSTAALQFKTPFQRPRPYQMAMVAGRGRLRNQFAKTASTPSLCSGHCLQGLMAVAAVFEVFEPLGVLKHEGAVESLQQLAVDIGDRRVMAGVHYPGDNLASWIIAVQLAAFVFRSEQVREFIVQAIQHRSVVYRVLSERVASVKDSSYAAALAEFNKLCFVHMDKVHS